MNKQLGTLKQNLKNFSDAPVLLKIYTTYCILGTFYPLVIYFDNVLYEKILPYIGFMTKVTCSFGLLMAIFFILTKAKRFYFGIMIMLYMTIFWGIFDNIRYNIQLQEDITRHSLTQNLYLVDHHHPYRPIFTIGLPVFWIMLLNLKSIRSWCLSKIS